MPVRIQTVEEATRLNGVKFIVYGKAKLGKTTLVGTCPNPIIISAERGLLSLRKNPATLYLPAIQVTNISEFNEAHDWCIHSQDARKYDTFFLDSISEIAEVCLVEERQKSAAKALREKKKANGYEPYTELSNHIMSVLRSFRDHAHKHVIMIAKEEFAKEPDGLTMYRPTMPGRELNNQLPYLLDIVLQLNRFTNDAGLPYNALRTTSDAQNVAGDRSGKLDIWEPADINYIINKILS